MYFIAKIVLILSYIIFASVATEYGIKGRPDLEVSIGLTMSLVFGLIGAFL